MNEKSTFLYVNLNARRKRKAVKKRRRKKNKTKKQVRPNREMLKEGLNFIMKIQDVVYVE